jgi:hypothetical protein
MAESSWPASKVRQEHLQNLMSQGYMTVVELATYHVLTPVRRYVVVCMAF